MSKMLYERRPCQPACRPPDKRDFMDYNPAKSADDFYKNYDPMVGIGTAGILLLFIVLLTAKSLLRWALKHWRLRKYVKKRENENKKQKKLVTIVAESTVMATPPLQKKNCEREQKQLQQLKTAESRLINHPNGYV